MEGLDMAGNAPSMKELTQMINSILGQQVLSEQQLKGILEGARRAGERGGMSAVLDYLLNVTQADVDKKELQQFADSVRTNPQMGMDMLQGKRKRPGGGGKR
jgi:pantothenate synthetase